MKTIAIVSNTLYSIYNFRIGLIRYLKERGYRVIAIAPYDEYSDMIARECEFIEIKNLERKGTNPFKDLMLFIEYFNIYGKIKPDVVINYTIKPNIYSSFACGLRNIPAISVVTGLGYVFHKGGLLKNIVKILYKVSLKMCKYIIVLNKDDMEELAGIVTLNKLRILNGEGINTNYFSPRLCQNYEYIREKNVIFLYIGRFLRSKGVLELVKATEILHYDGEDFELWMVGSPDAGNPDSLAHEELEYIRKLKFVRVYPFTRDVREYICKADAIVYPSYREGLPRGLLEAMAMAKPIITTNAPGCREVIFDGRNGFLVEPKDYVSLYEAMKKFMKLSKIERVKIGMEGRRIAVELFDEKIINSHFAELIENALNTN